MAMKILKVQVSIAVSTLFLWIGIGTITFRILEEWNWVESFYFSVVTITTVGYGDLTPSSDASKLFTAIYILIGVSIGVTSLGVIGTQILRRRESRLK